MISLINHPRNIHRPCSAAGPDKNRPVRWRNSSQRRGMSGLCLSERKPKHSSHQVGQLDIVFTQSGERIGSDRIINLIRERTIHDDRMVGS